MKEKKQLSKIQPLKNYDQTRYLVNLRGLVKTLLCAFLKEYEIGAWQTLWDPGPRTQNLQEVLQGANRGAESG